MRAAAEATRTTRGGVEAATTDATDAETNTTARLAQTRARNASGIDTKTGSARAEQTGHRGGVMTRTAGIVARVVSATSVLSGPGTEIAWKGIPTMAKRCEAMHSFKRGEPVLTETARTQTEKKYRLVGDVSAAPAATPSFDAGPPTTSAAAPERPVFYESRRGDDNNIRYGGLHRGDVPRYRRAAGGKVLGLNEGLRITKETAYTGRGVEIAPLNRFRVSRHRSSSDASLT